MPKSSIVQRTLPDLFRPDIQTQSGLDIRFGSHPEDQIISIVRQRGTVMLSELPKNLRRTSRWTLNLEKQGLLKRVQKKGKDGLKRLQLVYCLEKKEERC